MHIVRHTQLLFVLLVAIAFSVPAFADDKDILRKDPTRSYGAVDVILYETTWCPYCQKARTLLREMGVSLVEYDVEQDEAKHAEMVAKSGARGVPVIDIEGTILRGYSESAIRKAVETQRRK